MLIQCAHKIRVYPNNKQANYFARACGVARFAYNWGLEQWTELHKAGEKPNANDIDKMFNAIKKTDFPFVKEVTKCAAQRAILNLGVAYKNFYRNVKAGTTKAGKDFGYPKFKKKGVHDSFYLANDSVKVEGKRVFIAKLGWVKMAESLRFDGKIMSATVSRKADMWFVSVSVQQEVPDLDPVKGTLGIDVGIRPLAVTSDGEVFENPQALKQAEKTFRRLYKAVSRKQRGSKNRKKAVVKLARQHHKVSCIRKDVHHKATTAITTSCDVVCIETLNIRGMTKNRKTAKALHDSALSIFFEQIRYKSEWRGISVVKADRWFPSSKTCSGCGHVKANLLRSEKLYKCDVCGLEIDRDLNAAINLKNYAVGSTVKACRLGSAGPETGSPGETTDWAGISQEAQQCPL